MGLDEVTGEARHSQGGAKRNTHVSVVTSLVSNRGDSVASICCLGNGGGGIGSSGRSQPTASQGQGGGCVFGSGSGHVYSVLTHPFIM